MPGQVSKPGAQESRLSRNELNSGYHAGPRASVALRLAERLGIRAVDLDRLFAECAGDISEYINRFGYYVYARQNVETYRLMPQESTEGTIGRGGRSSDQSPIPTLCRSTAPQN